MKQRKKTEILQTSKLLALRLRAAVTVYLLGGNNNGSGMCAIYDQFNKIIAVVQK